MVDHLTDYDTKEKLAKINKLDYNEAMKLIYQWIKTDVINFKQF